MKNPSLFVERLRELMKEKELNANQLSKQIEYDFKAVSRWLDGSYYPRHYALIDLADYFNCSVDYILGVSDNESFKRSNPQSNFQVRLSLCLQRNKITRYRLSKMCNIAESSISKWMNDGRIPETAALIVLAQELDCSVEFLLGRAED